MKRSFQPRGFNLTESDAAICSGKSENQEQQIKYSLVSKKKKTKDLNEYQPRMKEDRGLSC